MSYSLSDGFAKPFDGLRLLLVARVAVGTVGVICFQDVVPPDSDGAAVRTMVDNVRNPTVFVSHQDFHAIVDYVCLFRA